MTYASDPDTPTISFTSPTTNILSASSIFSVDASDAAGPGRDHLAGLGTNRYAHCTAVLRGAT